MTAAFAGSIFWWRINWWIDDQDGIEQQEWPKLELPGWVQFCVSAIVGILVTSLLFWISSSIRRVRRELKSS